jgi:hypothetical protein
MWVESSIQARSVDFLARAALEGWNRRAKCGRVVMADESMVRVNHVCHRDTFGDGSARSSGGAFLSLSTRESSVAPTTESQ